MCKRTNSFYNHWTCLISTMHSPSGEDFNVLGECTIHLIHTLYRIKVEREHYLCLVYIDKWRCLMWVYIHFKVHICVPLLNNGIKDNSFISLKQSRSEVYLQSLYDLQVVWQIQHLIGHVEKCNMLEYWHYILNYSMLRNTNWNKQLKNNVSVQPDYKTWKN